MYISIEKNGKNYSTLPDGWDTSGKTITEFERSQDEKIIIRQSEQTYQEGKYIYYNRIAEIELTEKEAEILYYALKNFINKLNGIETINPDLSATSGNLRYFLDDLKSKNEMIKYHLQQILDLAKLI